QVQESRGGRNVLQGSVSRMKRQRNKCLKTLGIVLQRAQPQQVIDAIFLILDVAVQHGAIGFQPELVRGAGYFQPLVSVDLVIANNTPYAVMENLRAASRERI